MADGEIKEQTEDVGGALVGELDCNKFMLLFIHFSY